jgi:hypothetical protein
VDFTLIVDDFGVKYVGREHAMHLLNALRDLHTITEDWGGSLYSGLTIKWNYAEKYVDISMPHYIPSMLHRFQHPTTNKHQGAPHAWTTRNYGAKVQHAANPDDSPKLLAAEITKIQQQVGTLLCYAVSVDPFMLTALSTIASSQSQATQLTKDECLWLMDYAASNPLSIIRYHASGMILCVHSDASYLSESRARSRASGHFFLSSAPIDSNKPPATTPPLNGPIQTLCTIIDAVVGSAAEAEIAAGCFNGQNTVPIVTTLEELGHKQPPTPIEVNNTTSEGFANDAMKQKRSKAMDMRWHWLKDRVRQKQFLVCYGPGKDNLADPFNKHHTPAHIRAMKPKFVHTSSPAAQAQMVKHHLVRGCVNSGGVRPSTVCPPTGRVPPSTGRTLMPNHFTQAKLPPNNINNVLSRSFLRAAH